jgi:hypothetical protein
MASTESRASASNPSGTASDSDVGEPPLGDDDRPRNAQPYIEPPCTHCLRHTYIHTDITQTYVMVCGVAQPTHVTSKHATSTAREGRSDQGHRRLGLLSGRVLSTRHCTSQPSSPALSCLRRIGRERSGCRRARSLQTGHAESAAMHSDTPVFRRRVARHSTTLYIHAHRRWLRQIWRGCTLRTQTHAPRRHPETDDAGRRGISPSPHAGAAASGRFCGAGGSGRAAPGKLPPVAPRPLPPPCAARAAAGRSALPTPEHAHMLPPPPPPLPPQLSTCG